MRLQALNEFSQSPGGIGTWAIVGVLFAATLMGVAFLAAKRKAATAAKKALASKNVTVQRNPLTSVRTPPQNTVANRFEAHKLNQSFPPAHTSPVLAPKSPLATSPALNTLLQAYSKPITSATNPQRMVTRSIASINQRADMKAFQATTVRAIRSPSTQSRVVLPTQSLKPK